MSIQEQYTKRWIILLFYLFYALLPCFCVVRFNSLCLFFHAGVSDSSRQDFLALTDYEWSVYLVRRNVIIFV